MIGGSNPTHFNAANVSEPNEELRQEEEGGRAGLSLGCVEVRADHPLLPLPSPVAGSAHYALHHPGEPHSIELLVCKRADDLAVRFVRSFARLAFQLCLILAVTQVLALVFAKLRQPKASNFSSPSLLLTRLKLTGLCGVLRSSQK